MIFQHVQRVGGQGGDPCSRIQQEEVLPGRQVQRQLRRGTAQQRRTQPARFDAHLLEGLRRVIELVDIQVEYRRQRHTAHGSLNGHGAGGTFLHVVDDRIAQIVQQVQPQRVAEIDPHHGKAALRRGAVIDFMDRGVKGQRGRVIHRHNTVSGSTGTQRQYQVRRRADAVMGDGVGETLCPAHNRGAGVGQVVGVAAIAINGQRTVLALNNRAVGIHAGGDTQCVGDSRDRGPCRGVVAARGRVGVENYVTVQAGVARHGTGAGFFHRHIEAGVGAGRQQVSVIAQHPVVAVRQPGQVQRYAGSPEGQQIGKLGLSGIHHGSPGTVDVMLYHQLKGIEQGEHRTRGIGVHHNIRIAAAAHREVHLGSIITQQREDVAYGTHQQEAIITVLAVGDGGRGADIQLFDVIAGGERDDRCEG